MKQNPFSLYDFLGYLLPGLVIVSAMGWALDRIDFNHFNDTNFLLGLVLFSYVAGHCLALCSAVTVEKFHVLTIGYPSAFLIGRRLQQVAGWKVFFLSLLLPPLGLYYLFQLCSGTRLIAKALPSSQMIRTLCNRIEAIRTEIGYSEDDKPLEKDADFFRPIYHYVLERSNNHREKLQNYVALYGLLRSLCLGSCLMMWVSVGWFVSRNEQASAILAITAGILTILFYFGFAKFYRRFSLEVLMAALVTSTVKQTTDPSA